MEVSINILRGFASVLRELSIDFERLLRESGIEISVFERSQGPVDLGVAERAMRAAFTLMQEPGLGLAFGARAPFQSLGMLGEVLTHSPTLRAAIGELTNYLPLVFPMCRFRLLEEGDRAFLIYEPPFSEAHAARFTTEVAFAFAVRIGQQLVPGGCPLEVRVRHAAPHYSERYTKSFGCPVRFDATRSEIVFPRAMLDVPQPFVDETLWRLLKRRADELLVQERARELLHERVKQVLRHEVDLGSVNPCNIARRLGVSPRSLRRRLGDEGHSLSALADQVRRELALSELSNPEIPIKRIADRVGFSEVSAFHRAFKRWTGVTPARYRAQAFLAHAS
ncbi:MAG TPA: AraC family transcriptional regulator [Polyangiales bacterium]|nr:AraC family transcriptional regulator [Polyangiales bacterium]